MFDHRRPDPQQGVFETLLVVGSHPVELEAHLNRLESSLEELFPDHPLPDLRGDVPEVSGPYGYITSGTSGLSSARITVAPDGSGELEAQIERRSVPVGGETSLQSLALAGGLGAHKWTDRSLLDEAQATLPEGALPLLVEDDGAVLEASRANVFAVRDGVLLTPPLDGRILPGVTRMRVIELAGELGIEAHEAGLSLGDLAAADEVFLTGSVRGIEPVGAIDGVALAGGGNVTSELGAELWRTWVRAKVG